MSKALTQLTSVMIKPERLFVFLSDNFPLIKEIFKRESVGESDLRVLVRREQKDPPQPFDKTIDALKKLGIIEASAYSSTSFEITPHLRKYLEFIIRELQIIPTAVIKGFIESLESLSGRLADAIVKIDHNLCLQLLTDCAYIIEELRRCSSDNRQAIIDAALQIKSNRNKLTIKERFSRVNRIHAEYLIPLRDLLDCSKPVQESLDQITNLFQEGIEKFLSFDQLSFEFEKAIAKLHRLKENIREDFYASWNEIDPLYKSLSRETLLIKGAAKYLMHIDRNGYEDTCFDEALKVIQIRLVNLFSDEQVKRLTHKLKDYRPEPPRIQMTMDDGQDQQSEYINPIQLKDTILENMPIADILGFLIATFGDKQLSAIIDIYHDFLNGDYGALRFSAGPKQYDFNGHLITTYQASVEGVTDGE